VLEKGTPTVKLYASNPFYWNIPFTLTAEVLSQSSGTSYSLLGGTVAFTVGGIEVPDCQTVQWDDYGSYRCEKASVALNVDTDYTVEAAYTPTGWYANYYNPAKVSRVITVNPIHFNIHGMIFKDQDKDGKWMSGEYGLGSWTVNLDKSCDGDVDATTNSGYNGYYEFLGFPSGYEYCVTAEAEPGYQQTTDPLEGFVLIGNTFSMNIGFYYPTLTFKPSEYELLGVTVGLAYSQAFAASGGTEPYTYKISDGNLPSGLTLSTAGVLSGTPDTAGTYYFAVRAEDKNQVTSYQWYSLTIEKVKIDGVFVLTSSPNPSTVGDAVTFTLSATGGAGLSPTGVVAFLADGTPIDGCSNLYLNVVFDPEPNFGNYPATCTSTLDTGDHKIEAVYTDWTGDYNNATRTLTQEVQANVVAADLSITKIDKTDPVKPGAKLDYFLTISNAGPDAAQNITLNDTLDRNTTYVSASAPKGWSCEYANYQVTCISSGLASGSSAVIKITVTVNKTAKVGKELVNNASVSSETFDPDLLNNSVVQKTLVKK
jgi:uncharacterized repeat protein (TIGR01451 family)